MVGWLVLLVVGWWVGGWVGWLVIQLASVCQVFGLLVSQQDSHAFGHSAIWTVGWLLDWLMCWLVWLVG